MKAISINPSRIAVFNRPDVSFEDRIFKFKGRQVAKNARKKAALSKKAKRRMRNASNWLCFLSRKRNINPQGGKNVYNFQISFITLTLPVKQMHTHSEIKSKCLHQFLTQIGKHFKIKNYLWKAELQKNGNVHFHLTTDVYIHYAAIRRYWNQAIAKLGYIDRYQEIFAAMSFKEYHYWRCQQGSSDYQANRRAFDFGVATNWRNPNTTDVRKVQNVENLAAYISKYFSKPPVDESSGHQGFRNSISENFYFVQDKNVAGGPVADSAKELVGRLWYCSQSLSRLGNFTMPWSFENNRFLKMLRKSQSVFQHIGDWCELMFFKIGELPKMLQAWLTEGLINHALNSFYPFPAGLPDHGNQIFPKYSA